MKQPLSETDNQIYTLIQKETERQEYGLELIPSENYVSQAVLDAMGSIATNKYAEGLPGKRYYGGCYVVDQIEEIAKARLIDLFGCDACNVQTHSGATANQAVFEAVLTPGDKILGMKLDHGGHLTHGLSVNFSGKHYDAASYGVSKETGRIDYDQLRDIAKQHKPKLLIAGASAYSPQIDFKIFREVADEVGAFLLADVAHYAGLIAADLYPSPIEHSDFVTTTTHKTLRGPRSGVIMSKKEHIKAINKAVFPGLQGGPHMHTIAAKAICFKEAAQPEFKEYGKQVIANAKALASTLAEHGFNIISGGTESHVMLVDLQSKNVMGKDAEQALDLCGITVNKNTIPFDPSTPFNPSGIRLGTPAITTRGMGVGEMEQIAGFITEAIEQYQDASVLEKVKQQVKELCLKFPMYAHKI